MADRSPHGPPGRALIASALALLTVQLAATLTFTRSEYLPSPPPLAELPDRIGAWQLYRDDPVLPEVAEMLGPDDMLSRTYQLVNGEREASLFVAYYRTQLRAKNAHDPKVCLPGSGWNVRESSVIDVPLAEAPRSSEVNFYVISKLDSEAVVLYWYQTHKRVVAREQKLRFYKVVDTFADRRSDMALVRIVVPVAKGQRAEATKLGKEMIRALYPELLRYFPASQT